MSLLKSLFEYAKAHSLDQDAYFKENEIEWLLCVSKELMVHLERLNGPRKSRGKPYHMPIPLKRSSGILPNFPADNPEYVLGLAFEGDEKKEGKEKKKKKRSDPKWSLKCYEAYIKLMEKAGFDCGDYDLRLIAKALRKHQGSFANLPNAKEVQSGDCVCPATLENGVWVPVSERPKVREWWIKNYPILQKMVAGRGKCLVTGEESDLARLHPLVTGVTGGKSTGVTLITYNAPSGQSFGKQQGENSPVSVEVALLSSVALSHILSRQSGKRRSVEIDNGLHMSFITKKDPEEQAADFVLSLLDPVEKDLEPLASAEGFSPRERRVWKSHQALFSAPGTGVLPPAPDTPVDLLVTKARESSSRLEVRFEQETFGQIFDNLKAYFKHMEIMDPWTGEVRSDFPLKNIWAKRKEGEKPKPPILRGLLDALKATKDDDGPRPDTAAGMFFAAIEGRPLPPEVLPLALAAAARTSREGNGIKTEVAALLKIYLNRLYSSPENHLMYRWRLLDPNFKGVNAMLDPECRLPSYVNGRALAAAERIQEIAIPKVNASVVKRLFDGVSRSPGTLMPAILANTNHHIAKIHRTKPRLAFWCRKLMEGILGLLTADKEKAFPRFLDLPDQGLFSLGYYHQRTDLFTKKVDKEDEKDLPEAPLQEAS